MQIEMSEYLVDYPGFRMGIMPTPHINGDARDKNGNDSRYVRTSSTGVMVVPKLAKNADIALDFMKFMLTQTSLERFVETTDGLTRPFTLKNPENCDFGSNYFASTVFVFSPKTRTYDLYGQHVRYLARGRIVHVDVQRRRTRHGSGKSDIRTGDERSRLNLPRKIIG